MAVAQALPHSQSGMTRVVVMAGSEGTFNVAVRVPTPVEGVLQSVVGTRARIGLSIYTCEFLNTARWVCQRSVSGSSLSIR